MEICDNALRCRAKHSGAEAVLWKCRTCESDAAVYDLLNTCVSQRRHAVVLRSHTRVCTVAIKEWVEGLSLFQKATQRPDKSLLSLAQTLHSVDAKFGGGAGRRIEGRFYFQAPKPYKVRCVPRYFVSFTRMRFYVCMCISVGYGRVRASPA